MPLVQNRTHQPRTTRLLSEYLTRIAPRAMQIFNFRLGAIDPNLVAQLGGGIKPGVAGVTRGYADALVVTPDEVQIWEAKNKVSDAAAGQLLGYAAEFAHTPEAAAWADRKITLHLLAAYDDPPSRARAESSGIEVSIYLPAWYAASQLESETQGNLRAANAKG